MIFGMNPKLDDRLIELLFDAPGLTANQLFSKVSEGGETYTIQALYYELRKLENTGIIYKCHKRFYLRPLWLRELHTRVSAKLSGPIDFSTLTLGKKALKWNLKSLTELHLWWSNVVSILLASGEAVDYYEWVPRAWFHKSSVRIEEQILREHSALCVPYHLAVGGDSPVDREYRDLRAHIPGETAFAAYAPDRLQDTYLGVIGPYTITINLEGEYSRTLNSLFDGTRQSHKWDQEAFAAFSAKPTSIDFRVENNADKANEFRAHLKSVIG